MDVTICIATHGDTHWADLAGERAIPSAFEEVERTSCQLIYRHDRAGNLADARNRALAEVDTTWVLHLDADDQLEAGYVAELMAAQQRTGADLLAPAVRYVRNGDRGGLRHERRARVPRVAGHVHACTTDCMTAGNWLVVGTLAPTAMLRDVGGWRDWPCYEDWDLFLRCVVWQQARAVAVPSAVYRAHVRPDSRNRGSVTRDVKELTHQRILTACSPGEAPGAVGATPAR